MSLRKIILTFLRLRLVYKFRKTLEHKNLTLGLFSQKVLMIKTHLCFHIVK